MMELSGKLKHLFVSRQWVFLVLVMVIISIFTGAVNPRFLTIRNLTNLLSQVAVIGLLACGATILIISGEIDISAGANVGLTACIAAILMRSGMSSPLAALLGILVAIVCSTLIGVGCIIFRAPSFIISLASISVFKGVALALTSGTLQMIMGRMEYLGSGTVLGFIPIIFMITLLGYVATHAILSYTKLGRHVYAIGDNPRAAFLAGINIARNKIAFFALNGFFVGLAAILLLARVGAAQPTTGSGMELQAIGAVVIGGTPMTGGKGNVVGTFFGVLLWGLIANALNMLGISPFWQEATMGSLIIVAVAITSLRALAEKSLLA
ncbi:ABC transporter permease [Candidatus Darwinibacter acetoxidans]|jgi:ribose transport system permease protein